MHGRSESRIVASETHARLYVRATWGADRTTKDCVDVPQLQGIYVRVDNAKHEGQPIWAGPIDPRRGYSVDSPGPCRVYSHKEEKGKLIYVVSDNPAMTQKGGLPGLLKSCEPHAGKPPYQMRDWRVANMKCGQWVPTPECPLQKVDFKTRLYVSSRHKPNVQGLYDLVDMRDGKPCWGYSTFRLWHDGTDQRWTVSELVQGAEKKLIRSEPCDATKIMPMGIKIWKIACAIRKAWIPGDFSVEVVDVGTSMGNALRSTTARVDEMKQALARQMIYNAPKVLEVVCPSIPKYDGKFELFEDEKHNHLPIWKLGDKRIYCGTHGHWQFTEHAVGMVHGTAGIRSSEANRGDLPHQIESWSIAEKTKPGAPHSWRVLTDIAVLAVGVKNSNEEALQLRVKELVTEVRKLRAVEGSGTIETYENQRWLPVKGWGTTMLPTDRPIWSRENGKGGLFQKEDAKPPKNCEWDGEWTICMEGAGKNGWTFASDFPDHGVHFKFQPKRGPTCCVRRRRWFRKYKPIENYGDDEDGLPEEKEVERERREDVSIIDVDEVNEDEEDEKLAVTTRSVMTAPSEYGSEVARGLHTARSAQGSNDEEGTGKKVSLVIPMEQSVNVPTDSDSDHLDKESEEEAKDEQAEEEAEEEESEESSSEENKDAGEGAATADPVKNTEVEGQPIVNERKRAVLQLIETELKDLGTDEKTTLERLLRVSQWIEALETPVTGTPTESSLAAPPVDLSPRVAEALQRLKDEVTALKEPETIGRKRSRSGTGIAEAAGLLVWEVASSRRALAVLALSAAVAAASVNTLAVTLRVPDTPTPPSSNSQGLTPSVTLLSLSRNGSLPRPARRPRLQRPPPLQPLEQVCLKPDEIQLEIPEHWRTPGPTSTPGLTPSITPKASATSTPIRTPRRRSWRSSYSSVRTEPCDAATRCVALCAIVASWRATIPVKDIIKAALVQQHGSMRGVAAYMNGLSTDGNGSEGILHHTMTRAGVGRYLGEVMRGAGSAKTWDVMLWLECQHTGSPRTVVKTSSTECTTEPSFSTNVPTLLLPSKETALAKTFTPRGTSYSPRPSRALAATAWNSVPRVRTVPNVNVENDDIVCVLMLQGECPMLSSERLISALKASVSQRLVTRLSSVKDIRVTRSECHATAAFVVEHGGEVGLQMLQRANGWMLRGVSGRWTVVGNSVCLASSLPFCPMGHRTEPLVAPSADTACDRCRGYPWGTHTPTQAFGCTECEYVLCPSCVKAPSPLTPYRAWPRRGASAYTMRVEDLQV